MQSDIFGLPFAYGEREFEQAMIAWLAEGDYVPGDIYDTLRLTEVGRIYMPFRFYNITFDYDWRANIGYSRTETHWTTETTTDANGNTSTHQVAHTTTVIDWGEHHDHIAGEWALNLPACGYVPSLELETLDINTRKRKKPVDVHGLLECFIRSAGGHQLGKMLEGAGQYALPQDISPESLDLQADHETREHILALIDDNAPGDYVEDIEIEGDHQKESFAAHKPFWVARYTYQDKPYIFMADGTDAALSEGSKPHDQDVAKAAKQHFLPLKIGLAVAVLLMLLSAVSPFPLQWAVGLALGIVAITWGYGAIRKRNLLRHEADRRAEQREKWLRSGYFFAGKLQGR